MEILTYSLWFTLIWWCVFFRVFTKEEKNNQRSTGALGFHLIMFYVPLGAILLEYLIVR